MLRNNLVIFPPYSFEKELIYVTFKLECFLYCALKICNYSYIGEERCFGPGCCFISYLQSDGCVAFGDIDSDVESKKIPVVLSSRYA